MYIVTGAKRKHFETLEEAVKFRADDPNLTIYIEDAFGNVRKVPDSEIQRTSAGLAQKAAAPPIPKQPVQQPVQPRPAATSQSEHPLEHIAEPTQSPEQGSKKVKIIAIIIMSLVLLYIAYMLVGKDILSIFKNIGSLVVILS